MIRCKMNKSLDAGDTDPETRHVLQEQQIFSSELFTVATFVLTAAEHRDKKMKCLQGKIATKCQSKSHVLKVLKENFSKIKIFAHGNTKC